MRGSPPTAIPTRFAAPDKGATIAVALDDPETGPSPGGGADQRDPRGAEGQASQPEPAKLPPPAHDAPRARVPVNVSPVIPPTPPTPRALAPAPPSPTDGEGILPHELRHPGVTNQQVLASVASFEEVPRARLKPARTRWAPARSPLNPSTTLRESSNRDFGTGPGRGSGPGGEGHGASGLVRRRFAFGGPSGAFRAEVCFIPGRVSTLKEIRTCEPAATFFTNELNVPPRAFNEGFPGITDRTEWFRIEYQGKFKVRVADYYTFRLLSDDGAILYIDGHKVIDNDGQHLPQSKSTTVTLDPGEHDLRVTYYQGPRDNIALQLFVRQYEQGEKLFGPEI